MRTFLTLLIIVTLALLACGQPIRHPGPFILKPGIFRATATSNITRLNVPDGGMIVQPVANVNNNAAEVNITFVITGQACELNDPLIFMYQPDDVNGNAITLYFPSEFFFFTQCGVEVES